jgi:hypothetical protein
MQKEIEVRFDGVSIILIAEEPIAFFRIIKALQNDGRRPEFRQFDEELNDKTCWQPLKWPKGMDKC